MIQLLTSSTTSKLQNFSLMAMETGARIQSKRAMNGKSSESLICRDDLLLFTASSSDHTFGGFGSFKELAVANFPSVYRGKKRAAWSQLDNAAYHLIDIIHRDRDMAARMMAADPALKSVSDQEISFVRRVFYFRHLRSRNADHWLGRDSNWTNLETTRLGFWML